MRWRSAEELLDLDEDPLEGAAAAEDARLEALEVATDQPWARRLVAALMAVDDGKEPPAVPVEEGPPPTEPEAATEGTSPPARRKPRPQKPRRPAAPWVELT